MFQNKFRPQAIDLRWKLKENRKYRGTFSNNWQTRIEWFPAGYKLNKKTIAKQFRVLHYLACHSPEPIAKKYKPAYNQFENKHFASKGKASMRFLNTWTAHSWL